MSTQQQSDFGYDKTTCERPTTTHAPEPQPSTVPPRVQSPQSSYGSHPRLPSGGHHHQPREEPQELRGDRRDTTPGAPDHQPTDPNPVTSPLSSPSSSRIPTPAQRRESESYYAVTSSAIKRTLTTVPSRLRKSSFQHLRRLRNVRENCADCHSSDDDSGPDDDDLEQEAESRPLKPNQTGALFLKKSPSEAAAARKPISSGEPLQYPRKRSETDFQPRTGPDYNTPHPAFPPIPKIVIGDLTGTGILEEQQQKSVQSGRSDLVLWENDGSNRPVISSWLEQEATSRQRYLQTLSPGAEKVKRFSRKIKYGTIRGVYLPCLQTMLGVIVFTRMSWWLGVSGVQIALLHLLMALVCAGITTTSLSAIATNGLRSPGGPYYMISRSLGKEFGGAALVLIFTTQCISVSLLSVGAAEVIYSYLIPALQIGDKFLNSRVWGSVVLLLIMVFHQLPFRWVFPTTNVLFAATAISLVSMFVGVFPHNLRFGLEGVLNGREAVGTLLHAFPGNLADNWTAGFEKLDIYDKRVHMDLQDGSDTSASADGVAIFGFATVGFLRLFAIFFPSMTGFMIGAQRSGFLKTPQKSIVRGTISAILTSTSIYILFILLYGSFVQGPWLRTKRTPYGPTIALVSWPHPLVTTIGIVLSAIGTGLQVAIGPPRMLQLCAKDNILPFLRIFRTNYFKRIKSSQLAIFTTYVLAEIGILVGDLDLLAIISTIAFLVSYCFINAATALLAVTDSPNWRPTFRFYHWSMSLAGVIICAVYMFLIHWIVAMVSIILVVALWKYVSLTGARVTWGTEGRYALQLQVAKQNLLDCEARDRKIGEIKVLAAARNWRPQVMLFVNPLEEEPKNHQTGAQRNGSQRQTKIRSRVSEQLLEEGYSPQKGNPRTGCSSLLGKLGFGKLERILPSFHKSESSSAEFTHTAAVELASYSRKNAEGLRMISFLSQMKKGGGLSIVASIVVGDFLTEIPTCVASKQRALLQRAADSTHLHGFTEVLVADTPSSGITYSMQAAGLGPLRPNTIMIGLPEALRSISGFVQVVKNVIAFEKSLLVLKEPINFPLNREIQNGYIDVYLVVHDGGLLAILPHFLRKSHVWRRCEVRIFAIAQLYDNSIEMRKQLDASVAALRLEAHCDVLEIGECDLDEFVYEKTVKLERRNLVLKQIQEMHKHPSNLSLFNPTITEKTYTIDKRKVDLMRTACQVNSLMRTRSSGSSLVFCNLPAPTRDQSDLDYVEYLRILTGGLKRVVLGKGNGYEMVSDSL